MNILKYTILCSLFVLIYSSINQKSGGGCTGHGKERDGYDIIKIECDYDL